MLLKMAFLEHRFILATNSNVIHDEILQALRSFVNVSCTHKNILFWFFFSFFLQLYCSYGLICAWAENSRVPHACIIRDIFFPDSMDDEWVVILRSRAIYSCFYSYLPPTILSLLIFLFFFKATRKNIYEWTKISVTRRSCENDRWIHANNSCRFEKW